MQRWWVICHIRWFIQTVRIRAKAWVTFQRTFWEIQAVESGGTQPYYSVIHENLGVGGKVTSEVHGGAFLEKRKGTNNLNFTKKNTNVHALPGFVHSTERRVGLVTWEMKSSWGDDYWAPFQTSAELWDGRTLSCKIKLCFGIRENGKRKASITGTSTIGLGPGWDVPIPRCTGSAQAALEILWVWFQDHSKVNIIIKWVMWISSFLSAYKVMFRPCCSLLSVH